MKTFSSFKLARGKWAKPALRLLLAATILVACKRELIPPPAPDRAQQTVSLANFGATLSSGKLLYEETFESNGPYFYRGSLQTSTDYGFHLTDSPVYQGSKAGRFELRDTDPPIGGGTRSEAKFPPLTNPDRWYAYDVYFPSANYKYDGGAEIVSQWHQGNRTSPSMSLITRCDQLFLEIRTVPILKTQFLLGNIVKDNWQNYVMHIIHSHGSDGLVELWHNGEKIFTRKGANSYSFSTYEKPTFKLGLYKWEWNGTQKTETHKRVIYFDNVRVGSELAAYNDMVQPAAETAPTATINTVALVNAETEKEIGPLKDGAVISLQQLKTKKLNILAIPNAAVGSVLFVLNGKQHKVTKDDESPYTLNGDNGRGNFYFDKWGPPPTGNYTLEITPYSDPRAKGLVGKTRTINFVITD